MSAEPNGSDGPEQEIPLDERVDTAVMVAYGRHGYIDETGEYNPEPLVEKMTALVADAVAAKKAERAKVCIMRRAMMQHLFNSVAGPEDWADQDDPDVAEEVYKRLDSLVWRLTSMQPNGSIQSRLNSEYGLILCRTKVNPHRTDAVYVTRDLGCLLEDAIKPQRAAEKTRADRDAAFTAMLIERVPEHGKRFNRELVGGLTTALNSAKAITAGALAALEMNVDDDDVEVGGDDE